jgi:hypothetical protein
VKLYATSFVEVMVCIEKSIWGLGVAERISCGFNSDVRMHVRRFRNPDWV